MRLLLAYINRGGGTLGEYTLIIVHTNTVSSMVAAPYYNRGTPATSSVNL